MASNTATEAGPIQLQDKWGALDSQGPDGLGSLGGEHPNGGGGDELHGQDSNNPDYAHSAGDDGGNQSSGSYREKQVKVLRSFSVCAPPRLVSFWRRGFPLNVPHDAHPLLHTFSCLASCCALVAWCLCLPLCLFLRRSLCSLYNSLSSRIRFTLVVYPSTPAKKTLKAALEK
jgi:hypothetical protein